MILLLESRLGWAGLTPPATLTIEEIPPDRWPLEHQKWDQYDQAARELFRVTTPDLNQLAAILAIERICTQIVRSQRDTAMVERLMPIIGQKTVADAVRFSRLFLTFILATRPVATA
jgi:hypothetical protein